MKSKEAVVKRINELCAVNDIALTVYSIMLPQRKDISISTITKLCDGFDITLREFFNSDCFDDIEQEIY